MFFSIVAPKIVVADHRSRDIAWPVTSTVEVEVGRLSSVLIVLLLYMYYIDVFIIYFFLLLIKSERVSDRTEFW